MLDRIIVGRPSRRMDREAAEVERVEEVDLLLGRIAPGHFNGMSLRLWLEID